MIERRGAELMEPTPEEAAAPNAIDPEEDVRGLMSFLFSDQPKSYCLYEAASPEHLVRVRLPADVITGWVTASVRMAP